ncbi:MAG: L-aspartate oxidase [Lachnospira sp.]|nr:L-aspartate oxidase [Lachnospira sp.]
MELHNSADIVIVGTGVSGLFAALNLPRDKQIIMITKSDIESSDSFLAQGGICVLKSEDDYDSYFEDTLRAGHYENRRESVDIMIRSSQEIIKELIGYGVDFEKDSEGNLIYTREGAHSTSRILFHEDVTGKEITSKLLEAVKQLDNVTILENTTMLDIVEKDNVCYGIVCRMNDGEENRLITISANTTIWACGGIGGLYTHSTNFRHLTGDALALALEHNIELENIDYIQIHPTTLYSEKQGRRFLISESVRGEGAVLLNRDGERFVDELLPRDVVAQAIYEQMEKDKLPYVRLSLENIDEQTIMSHFPNIYRYCLEEGYDITKEPIPVVPAQHYFMGGVHVDRDSKTTMDQLYAVGETSCNGVHGANRLASNSLLESLVFAKRAAKKITAEFADTKSDRKLVEAVSMDRYVQYDELSDTHKSEIFKEIEREKKLHEQYINEVKCR